MLGCDLTQREAGGRGGAGRRLEFSGGGRGRGGGGGCRTASWSLPAGAGGPGGSRTRGPAQPQRGRRAPRARPALGPAPRPAQLPPPPRAGPRAEQVRELPLPGPARRRPAPSGVCGVDASGRRFTAAGPRPRRTPPPTWHSVPAAPLHPRGAPSTPLGSVHLSIRLAGPLCPGGSRLPPPA